MVVGDERESKGRLSSADVYHGQGQDFILSSYYIPYQSAFQLPGLNWRGGGTVQCDGEEEDAEKEKGGGGTLEEAKAGWRGPRDEGAQICVSICEGDSSNRP